MKSHKKTLNKLFKVYFSTIISYNQSLLIKYSSGLILYKILYKTKGSEKTQIIQAFIVK